MVYDSAITDPTYYPHHKSVEDWYWENNAKTGVHQFLDNKMVTHTSSAGVTFTVSSDKTITLTGTGEVTVGDNDGTIGSVKDLPLGKYRLSGCPSGGSSSTYRLVITNTSNSAWITDIGNGVEFTLESGHTWDKVYIRKNSGVDVSGKEFKPLIKLASDTSDEVTDYAMTNAELTEWTTQNETAVELETGITKWTENVVCKQGKVCFMNLTVSGTFTANTEVLVGTIPANYRPRQILFFPLCTTGGYGYVKVGQNGTIKLNNIPANATNLGVFGSWLVP